MKKQELLKKIDALKCHSAWDRGVKKAAYSMVEDVEAEFIEETVNPRLLEKVLLNGAKSWNQYSWCGCALCYGVQTPEWPGRMA